MKRVTRILLFAIVPLFGAIPARAQQQQQQTQAVAAWTNQSGSTFYLESVGSGGLVTGYYINRASGFGCQNTAYPVTGWLYGTAMTFSVTWTNSAASCNSVTGWTGYFSSDFSTLTTNWVLAVNGSPGFQTGRDVFTRTARQQSRSLIRP